MRAHADQRHDDDPECIEVDLDIGFVHKSREQNFSDDDDDKDSVVGVGHGNRYISIEESVDEEDVDEHEAARRPRLETISDDDDMSSYVQQHSSKSSSFADRALSDIESLGSSPKRPIVVDSSGSLTDNGNDTFPTYEGEEGLDMAIGAKSRLNLDSEIAAYQSVSYESDNDEWLRKRDLATRKTQNPKSWLTRTTSEIQSKLSFVTVETPKPINGVAAAKKLLSRQPKLRGGRRRNPIPSSKVWKLSYKERTRDHSGYFDVDFFSLFDSSAVGALQPHHLDVDP